MKDFFVSYNQADLSWAEWIAWHLEEANYTTVLQEWDFRPGCNFVLEMQKASVECNRTVAILSPEYISALFTQPEWASAFAVDPQGWVRKLVPVKVRPCLVEGMLAQITYIDLVGTEETQARDRLLIGVQIGRAKPSSRPVFPAQSKHTALTRPSFPGPQPSQAFPKTTLGSTQKQNIYSRYKRLGLWERISLWGSVASIFAILVWVFGLLNSTKSPTESQRENITASDSVVQTSDGSLNVTYAKGISEESYRRLAEELGITRVALQNFFMNLKTRSVPLEDLDCELRKFAKNYTDLLEKIPKAESSDSGVTALRFKATDALRIGDFEQAEALLGRASQIDIDKAKEVHEAEKGRLLSAAATISSIGELKLLQSSYSQAAEYFQKAYELAPAGSEEVADYLDRKGVALHEAAKYAEAEECIKKGLEIRERLLESNDPRIAESVNNLAGIYHGWGKYKEAEPMYKRALSIEQRAFGLEHPRVALILNNLASLESDKGSYKEAEKNYKRVLQINEKCLGLTHPTTLLSCNNLAVLYQRQGLYIEAARLFSRVLEGYNRQSASTDSPFLAIIMNNFASNYESQGNLDKAEEFYLKSFRIVTNILEPDHPTLGAVLNNLAMLEYKRKKYSKAISYQKDALSISIRAFGTNHPDVARSHNNLGLLYMDTGDYVESETEYKSALEIQKRLLGPDHPEIAKTLSNLAILFSVKKQYLDAEPLYRESLSMQERILGPSHPDLVATLISLSTLLERKGEDAESSRLKERASRITALSRKELEK